MRSDNSASPQDFATAQAIHKQHGKSYYFAAQLFPKHLRQATYSLYAFFREPDEIVDNLPQNTPAEIEIVQRKLADWLDEWRAAYETGETCQPVLRAAAQTFHRYNIPYELSQAFLDAMIQDTEKATYENYAELENYMYGSAAVVGLMMSHVIGFSDEAALQHAKQLGYAMQLTNFLRDIDEDYQLRRRVYFPQDELANFGISSDDIAARNFSPHFQKFVKWQAKRAHELYDEADKGIPLLQPEGRLAVRLASCLYRAILDKIQAQNFDVFAGRAKTSTPEKLILATRAAHQNFRINRSK